MARRSGPLATLFQMAFALPFLVTGLLVLAMGVRDLQIVAVVFGLVFAGAGGGLMRSAYRAHRSQESLALVPGPGAGHLQAPPAMMLGYREAARPERTAREVYGPMLEIAPLPRLRPRVGRVLPVALAPADDQSSIFLLLFALVWNGFTLPLFVQAVASMSLGAIGFMSLFVLAGMLVLFLGVTGLQKRLALPRVEVAEDPAYLGDELRASVEQRGPIRITRLRISLACRESVRFMEGTTVRTEDSVVVEAELLDEPGITLRRGERWRRDLAARIPEAAPHSFFAPSNQIVWSLRVRAEIVGRPDHDAHFPFRALPRIPA